MEENKLTFRINTPQFLKEVFDAYPGSGGVLKVPANILRTLLAQVSQRCTELNDPVLDRLMFDLALYELPSPTTKEYTELLKKLYKRERDYLKATKR